MIRGPGLIRYAALSLVAAFVTIALKGGAFLTGSVGLLSDALESLVNLAAAVVALIALWVAARPADEDHAYGHTKAEYFSSGFEGALILVAAASIVISAVARLLTRCRSARPLRVSRLPRRQPLSTSSSLACCSRPADNTSRSPSRRMRTT